MEKRGITLVKWKNLSRPKECGGWGLKNIFHFPTTLSRKSASRLLSGKGLWCQVIIQKYIMPNSVGDWIRSPAKSFLKGSFVWKATVKAYSLIGN
jgi:hypothetical protein